MITKTRKVNTMGKRNTLSMAEKVKVVNFLTSKKDVLLQVGLSALSEIVAKETGISIDPAVLGYTYRSAADYPPLRVKGNEKPKAVSKSELVSRVVELEKRLSILESGGQTDLNLES